MIDPLLNKGSSADVFPEEKLAADIFKSIPGNFFGCTNSFRTP